MSVVINKNRLILFALSLIFLFALSTPAFGADKTIGKISGFSGKVLIKSQGSWGAEPKVGMSLFSGDKIVTRTGTVAIKFNDGAVMEIKENSNLVLEQRTKKKGFLSRVAVVERRLRLMVGKLFFRTGEGSNKAETRLETPTMVCGLRGTAGVISIGADGAPYIQFSDGGSAFTIGDFISGVAEDVPAEIADLNPAQRAAFVADAAASQAKAAAEVAAEAADTPEGDEARAQAAYAAAQAAELAAEEAKVEATIIIENSPDQEMVQEATAAVAQAEASIEIAEDAQQDAVDSGATPGPPEAPEGFSEEGAEGEEPPPEVIGFDVPVTEDPPIADEVPSSAI